MSTWMYTTTTGGDWARVIDKLNRWSTGYGIGGKASAYGFVAYWGAGWGGDPAAAFGTVNNGVWHHVAATVSQGVACSYTDGVLTTTFSSDSGSTITTNASSVIFGRASSGVNATTSYWSGQLQEVEISKTVRSADWIKLSYKNQGTIDSLASVGPALPTPTSAPTLTLPANGATGVAVLPTFTWGTVTGALTYRIQVSAVSDFSTIAANDSTPTTGTFTLTSPLSGSSTYYWRVNAKNAGGPSVWSSVFSFTTVAGVPAAPVLVAPVNAAINVVLAPTLTWGTVPGALSYRVQLSTISTFAATVADDSTLTAGTKAITGLAINTTYFFRANAKNIGGTSGWSSVFSFTTVPAAPAAPVLSAPANAATEVVLAPTLTWGTVTGAVTYRVQLSTISTFATTVVDDSTLTAGTKAVIGLANTKTYYWRANAKNAGGSGAWSSVFSFSTKVLAAPVLVSPANSAILTSSSVTLVWGTVSDAVTYRLQLSSVSSFASMVFEDSTLTSAGINFTLSNGTYFWRLSSKNAGGNSAWSTVNSFTMSVSGIAGVMKHYSPIGMGHNGILSVYRANGVRVMELAYGPAAIKSQLLNTASRTLAKGYYTYRFSGTDANVVIVGKLIK